MVEAGAQGRRRRVGGQLVAAARSGQVNGNLLENASRMGAEQQNAIGQEHCFVDIVGDEHHRLAGGGAAALP